MEVRNCARCGKIFNYVNLLICPECEKAEEAVFQSVKEYIDDNESCTLKELSENTGVQPKKIIKYIHEGRLEISKGMHGEITCDSCGKPITRGRFCDACVIKINQDVSEAFENSNKQVAKMHIKTKRL